MNNDKYLSVSEIAGLPGVPGSAYNVREKARRESWRSRERRGQRGGGVEYLLSDLPIEAQAAIAKREAASVPAAPVNTLDAEALTVAFDSLSAKQKARAAANAQLVRAYHAMVNGGAEPKAAAAAICTQFVVSQSKLTAHLRKVAGKPEHLWHALLAPQFVGRTVEAELSVEAWEILKADYLRPERPTALACIARLREMAVNQNRDWSIPSTRTLQRRLEKLPRLVKTLAREGAKAVKRLYPAQQRSKGALHALAIVNADGYKHNVWVRFPDGEIVRAKTWYWQDVYSSKILAWRTDKSEHTDMIRMSFGDLVEQWGIPEAVLNDNTRAAANKTMSGGVSHRFRFKVRDEDPDGVFKMLGVDVHWATPGHGQAKPIERAFGIGGVGEYIDKAPEMAGAWTGANPMDKPDYDGKSKVVELKDLQAVIAREIAAMNAREGRRGAMHRGRSFDTVFEESYKAVPIRRATEAQRRLWLLATEPVRAANDGAITLNAGRIVGERLANRYWHADLADYAGRMLAARFDPQRMHEGVHVYTADGRYLCYAECDLPAGFNDQLAGRERNRARNQFVKNVKAAAIAEQRMDVLDVVKARAGDAGPTIPAPAAPARTVIAAQFRAPIEKPASAVEQADMAKFEERFTTKRRASIHELHTDEDRHARWCELQAQLDAGGVLNNEEEQFWRAFQQSAYFRIKAKAEAEFENQVNSRMAQSA